MRYVSIDLSSDNYLQQPQIFGGYAGEHNETILQVKLPDRMVGIECSGYRFDFQTSEDNKISSPLILVSELDNDILSFKLTEQLTVAGKLLFNVVATLSNENSVSLTSKTNMVALYIGDSPDGNSILPDPNGYKDEMLEMIDDRIAEALKDIQTGEGGTIVIDQTFNPKSKNAQSGVAVAQAVATKTQVDAIRMWQPNTEYKIGDYVYSDAIGYGGATISVICECTEAHKSKDSVYADQKWHIMNIYASNSINDSNGNPIHETYATKDELAEAIGEALEGNY